MSLNIEGKKCAVCKEPLINGDDVVYCPECGASHHRECYIRLGHCGLLEEHGKVSAQDEKETGKSESEKESAEDNTPQNNEASKTKKCLSCGEEIPEDTRFCPFCGVPVTQVPEFAMKFAEFPKIDKNMAIAEGVTVGDAAKVVSLNPFRYIARFVSMAEGRKVSWNWAAFLLPGAWLAYRKMYKSSFAVTALLTMATLLNIPFNMAVTNLLPISDDGVNIMTLLSSYTEYLPAIGFLPFVLVFVGMLINVAIHFSIGMFGDYLYKNRVVEAVKLIREAQDEDEMSAKLSGVSFFGFALAFCALEFLPGIISMVIPF